MDMQAILSQVITRTNEIFEAEAGSVFLLDPSTRELIIRAAVGAGAETVRGLSLPVGQGVVGWVVAHEAPAMIPEVHYDARFFGDFDERSGFLTQSILCVPLQADGRTIGAIELMNMNPDYLSETGLKILSVIADHAALAIEHARLFAEVRAAEANYHDLFDNANDFIFTLDSQLKISSANKVVLKTTGYQPDEIIGVSVTKFVGPEQLPRLYKLLKDRLAQRTESTATFELPILGKEKQEILLEVTLRVQREGRRPINIHCIARDITHRHELEQQLQQTEKLSAIGKLVAGVAHELNNPLTTIIGYADLLQQTDLPQNYKSDLEVIFRQAQRAQFIVKDLLTFARRFEPKPQLVDLNEVISGSLSLMKNQLQSGQIQVKTIFDFNLPAIMADPLQLEQVLVNLITNAVHALVTIPEPRQLIVETRQVNQSLVLSFADNGPGIPNHIITRIFDPFFSTKQVGRGTGLGLSICFGIISQHKGRIWADNNPTGGAIFYVELPIEKPAEPRPAPPPALPVVDDRGMSLKILVVDDEAALVKLLSRVLRPKGYQVETALDGQSALHKLKTQKFDLVICDILMPDIFGTELYQQTVKILPHLANCFIFISGNVVDPETRNFLEQSGLPWLAKPFLPSEVEEVVAQMSARLKNLEVDKATPMC